MKKKKEKEITADDIQEYINDINKEWEDNTAMIFKENETFDFPSISTGSIMLDHALGIGGVGEGKIIEIKGFEGAGKTSLALQILAHLGPKDYFAFIDTEHALNVEYARSLGVNTGNMIISQPDSLEQALDIAYIHAKKGLVKAFVFDSVAAAPTERELAGKISDSNIGVKAFRMSAIMRKIKSKSNKNNVLCIFLNQLRDNVGNMYGPKTTSPGGHGLKFAADQSLELDVGKQIKVGSGDNQRKIGHHVKIKVVKNKLAVPFRKVVVPVIYGYGLCKEWEILEMGLDKKYKILEKKGTWISYKGAKIGQGVEKAFRFLLDNPELTLELETKIKEKLYE